MIDSKDLRKGGVIELTKRMSIMLLAKIFVVLVCASLLVADALRTWNAHEIRLQEAQILASNLAQSLAQHAEDTIKEADTILVGLVERVEVDGTKPANLTRLQGLLSAHVAELPKLHGIFLYDETGRWLVTSNKIAVLNANNSDRDYFIFHRTHPDRSAYIGKPVRSRSTGEWIVTVSRRINYPDGSFAGVALATLHMSYFTKFYEAFNIGSNGTILLAHADGTLLVHRPFSEARIGASLKESELFQEYLPVAPSGTYTSSRTSVDSLDRIFSYRRTQQYPLVLGVSLSKDEVLRSWWSDAYRYFLGSAILALALGYLGLLLTRQIGLRVHAEGELRLAQSKLKRFNRELKKMAMQDGLTGLANRRLFDIVLNDEFNRAMRNNNSLALIMIDVDSFKQYNDTYGHPAGDECLKKIAQAVKSNQNRSGDLTARYGGEEIAVLLPDTDITGAVAVAERVRLAVRELQIAHAKSEVGVVTVSCGVEAILPIRKQHIPSDLVHGADKALYLAKSGGRDHVVPALAPNAAAQLDVGEK